MKIIILCTQLEGGGAQRASYKLSNELLRRGIDTENWFLYKKRDNFSGLGKTVCFLDRPISRKWDYFTICVKYFKLLKKENPDAVIAFTHYANVLGLFIAFLAGVKIRVASHRNPSWGDMSKSLITVDNFLAKFGIYTSITAVSKSTKESFDYYPQKIFNQISVINNGLKTEEILIVKDEAREVFSLPENIFLIGTIGRLSRQKNHKLLFEIIRKLPENVHLAIAGDGELKTEALATITEFGLEGRVWLLGEIEYNKITVFLKSLDIYVMPSLFEGLSNALVEAMAAGLPVVSSNIDAQRDVLISENGKVNGILLDPTNSDLWTTEINTLLKSEDLLKKYSMQSILRAQDFTVEKMAEGFLKVLINNKIK